MLKMMNDIPTNQFQIPCKADLTFGRSMGEENEVTDINFAEDGLSGEFTLEGFEDDLDGMYEHWKNTYSVVEYEDIGEKEEVYVRKREIFQEKLALKETGITRYIIKRKFRIIL